LKRTVALKMILAGKLASPAEVQRFRLEAEAAANLDHPNIVPIYEVGEHGGQHYFTMKLIEGGSLAEHIRGREPAPGPEGQRSAAELVATVARAVHHAHQRGILHRDLKPANILLQIADCGLQLADSQSAVRTPQSAIPLVSDFGLAKRMDGDGGLTQSGGIVGTPSYMAPEQVAGKKLVLTTAVDVYSLGGILYFLLAGRPPFRAETALDTMVQVMEREPERPRLINPALHRDLETICLKCLEKEPARRYPSAEALADELQRFLDGEAIEARPVGRVEWLGRWCRRRPALAGLTAALALVIVAAFVVVTWQWRHSERLRDQAVANLAEASLQKENAEQQRRESERNWHLAEANYRQSRKAVDDFTRLLSENPWFDSAGLHPFRKRLLEVALGYYQDFLDQRGNDPALRAELASTYYRVGQITSLIGSKTEAKEAYRRSLALYQDLVREGATPHLQAKLAGTYNNLGILHVTTGQPAEARRCFEKARDLHARLVAADPANREAEAELAGNYHNLGTLHREAGRLQEARTAMEQARDIREKLVRSSPDNPGYKGGLAATYNNLGNLLAELEQRQQAEESYQRGLELRRQLARANPDAAFSQSELADSYRNLGNFQLRTSRPADALQCFQAGQTILEQLVRTHPAVVRYQSDLAACYTNLGVANHRTGNETESRRCHERSRDMWRKIVARQPDVPRFQSDLAQSWFNLSVMHGAAGRRDESLTCLREARALQEKVVGTVPDNLDYHSALAGTLNNFALALADGQQFDEAVATCREAIEHQRFAFTRAPEAGRFRRGLNNHYGVLARLLRHLGRPGEAAVASMERRKLWPNDPGELFGLARELAVTAALVGKGKRELTAAEKKERGDILDQAMETLRQAIDRGFQDAKSVREHPDLESLRPRADFQALLSKLKTP
jgi:tetratricopeptide (TPR) repeat protein